MHVSLAFGNFVWGASLIYFKLLIIFFIVFDITMLCKGLIGAVSWCGWKIEGETKLFNSTADCISHGEIILLITDD